MSALDHLEITAAVVCSIPMRFTSMIRASSLFFVAAYIVVKGVRNLLVPFEYIVNHHRVADKVPISKLIKFAAGCCYVSAHDGPIAFRPPPSQFLKSSSEVNILNARQGFVKAPNCIKAAFVKPEHPSADAVP